jgi:hypothetical protein
MEPTVTAESSTAVVEPKEVFDLTPAERENWLKTGDRPAKPVKDDSATSKPAEQPNGAGKKAESGTAKEPDEERNWKQLRETAKQAKERADRLEAEIAELRKAGGKKDEKPAESSTAAPAEKPQAPVKPKRADFASDEEYEKAYEEKYLPEKRAFDTATAAYEKQQSEITERQKGLLGSWKGIADKGKELLGEGDWKKVTDAYNEFQIFAGDPFEVHLRGSEPDIAARFMQYMSLKPADVKRIIKLPLREQFKELDALETALRAELGKSAAPLKSEEKPLKKEKEITAAGKPPSEPGGQAATAEDEADAALKRGDGESYRRIMNEREIAKRRAGRKGR